MCVKHATCTDLVLYYESNWESVRWKAGCIFPFLCIIGVNCWGNVKDSPELKLHKAALESGNPASSIQTCTYTFSLPLSVSLSQAHTHTCTAIYPISFIPPHQQLIWLNLTGSCEDKVQRPRDEKKSRKRRRRKDENLEEVEGKNGRDKKLVDTKMKPIWMKEDDSGVSVCVCGKSRLCWTKHSTN